MNNNLLQIKNIHRMYKSFRGDMTNIWEEYYYLSKLIDTAPVIEFKLLPLENNKLKLKNKQDAGGMKSKFINGGNTKSHYIETICKFEDYINSLTSVVYHDFPQKISGAGMDNQKLFNLILESEDKQSILNVIIEEKIRSIFYGNPIDIFTKDKCKLELGNVFTEKYQECIPLFGEIIGRRNAIIHNSGKADKKFILENSSTNIVAGRKIIISEKYLRGTIGLLSGIAAITTKCVVENIYHGTTDGVLENILKKFNTCYDGSWYKDLLENN